MKIEQIWPQTWPGSSILARFDLRITPDLLLCGLHLKRGRDGALHAYAPRVGSRTAFHMAPETSTRAASLAAAALGQVDARD